MGSAALPDSELAELILRIRVGFNIFRGDSAGFRCFLWFHHLVNALERIWLLLQRSCKKSSFLSEVIVSPDCTKNCSLKSGCNKNELSS